MKPGHRPSRNGSPASTLAMRLHAPGRPLVCEETPLAPLLEHQVLHRGERLRRLPYRSASRGRRAPRRAPAGDPRARGRRSVVEAQAARAWSTRGSGVRVGVPWLGQTCGVCGYCISGRENLCANARFTGYTRDGGYAEYPAGRCALRAARFRTTYDDAHAAAAALRRAHRLSGISRWPPMPRTVGLYGFGAAAHLIAQVALAQGRTVYAFARPGDAVSKAFARRLGCALVRRQRRGAAPPRWDAALIFAPPVGPLVPAALAR